MENGIGKLSWANIKSALVYGVMWTLLAVCVYIVETGSIYAVNWKEVLNSGVLGLIGIIISIIKNLLTTSEGDFVGLIKVIPPTK